MILFLAITLSPFSLAESLFIHKDFYDAITEYKRFIFLNPPDSLVDYAHLRIGLGYKEMEDYPKAIKTLRELSPSSKDISSQTKYNLAEIYFKEGSYLDAEIQLNALLNISNKKKTHLLLGWVNLYQKEIDEAERHFLLAHKDSLARSCEGLKNLPYKDPQKARILSIILPGLGEIYANHYKTGILSFLVNSLCIAGIGISLKERKYMDASLIFSFLFQRFYVGSQNNAYDFTKEYNERIFKEKIRRLKIQN